MNILTEICIESVADALAAKDGGAARVELCANLLEGGTTPSYGSIKLTREVRGLKLMVMIRPRGGDFLYSSTEFEVMKEDLKQAKELGADGVVFGILKSDGTVDIDRCGQLLEIAKGMDTTFHRAFDMVKDPYEALEDIIDLGFNRILTSGGEVSVLEGIDMIKELMKRAAGRIIIMPGGGINARNISKIVSLCNPREIHFTARKEVESGMEYRNYICSMGGALRPPEYSGKVTDSGKIRNITGKLKGMQ